MGIVSKISAFSALDYATLLKITGFIVCEIKLKIWIEVFF